MKWMRRDCCWQSGWKPETVYPHLWKDPSPPQHHWLSCCTRWAERAPGHQSAGLWQEEGRQTLFYISNNCCSNTVKGQTRIRQSAPCPSMFDPKSLFCLTSVSILSALAQLKEERHRMPTSMWLWRVCLKFRETTAYKVRIFFFSCQTTLRKNFVGTFFKSKSCLGFWNRHS